MLSEEEDKEIEVHYRLRNKGQAIKARKQIEVSQIWLERDTSDKGKKKQRENQNVRIEDGRLAKQIQFVQFLNLREQDIMTDQKKMRQSVICNGTTGRRLMGEKEGH